MAITSSSRICSKAIQTYETCGIQCAGRSSLSKIQAVQNTRNEQDTVQFSQEALDRLELLKQGRTGAVPKETATIQGTDSELEKNLKILGLNKDASIEEIRKAYLYAIQQYHPDKYACLAPEFRQLAETRSKQINELYSTALKLKNAGSQSAANR